jgi:hypothetical protein
MRIAVVHESVHGNTEAVARAIAAVLAREHTVVRGSVEEVPAAGVRDVDLLVLGAPTHLHGLPSRGTMLTTRERGGVSAPAPDILVRDWIEQLPPGRPPAIATFDTRSSDVRLISGSAARTLRRRLRRSGHEVVATESFVVTGGQGPLAAGELARAEAWAERLGELAPTA